MPSEDMPIIHTFALILLIIGAIVKVKGLLEFRVYTKQLAKGQNAIMYQKTLSNDQFTNFFKCSIASTQSTSKMYKRYALELSESYKYSESTLSEGIVSKKWEYIPQKVLPYRKFWANFERTR